jgi:hypothetical protein
VLGVENKERYKVKMVRGKINFYFGIVDVYKEKI